MQISEIALLLYKFLGFEMILTRKPGELGQKSLGANLSTINLTWIVSRPSR